MADSFLDSDLSICEQQSFTNVNVVTDTSFILLLFLKQLCSLYENGLEVQGMEVLTDDKPQATFATVPDNSTAVAAAGAKKKFCFKS